MCRTQASMAQTSVPRFSGPVRLIGGILLIPTFLGFAFAGLLMLSTFMAAAGSPHTNSDAAAAGQVIGFGIGFIFAVIVGIVSLVGGLLGWLLLMNRKVYKCSRCAFVVDRG